MAVLLHKWEFKNIEVAFLKVSEKIWPGFPDTIAEKSWDFLILTVSVSTVANGVDTDQTPLKVITVLWEYRWMCQMKHFWVPTIYAFMEKQGKYHYSMNTF